jgi:hypothetical protein
MGPAPWLLNKIKASFYLERLATDKDCTNCVVMFHMHLRIPSQAYPSSADEKTAVLVAVDVKERLSETYVPAHASTHPERALALKTSY